MLLVVHVRGQELRQLCIDSSLFQISLQHGLEIRVEVADRRPSIYTASFLGILGVLRFDQGIPGEEGDGLNLDVLGRHGANFEGLVVRLGDCDGQMQGVSRASTIVNDRTLVSLRSVGGRDAILGPNIELASFYPGLVDCGLVLAVLCFVFERAIFLDAIVFVLVGQVIEVGNAERNLDSREIIVRSFRPFWVSRSHLLLVAELLTQKDLMCTFFVFDFPRIVSQEVVNCLLLAIFGIFKLQTSFAVQFLRKFKVNWDLL